MTMDAFVAALCERLNVPIDDVDVNAILDLAKDAAHNVERPAAPVTTFIAGYAAALQGGGSAAVDAAADAAAELAAQWPDMAGVPDPAATTPTLDSAAVDTGEAAGPSPTSGAAGTPDTSES
ncbi:DUF6457 domain-containing protein [Phytoactinopolyspora alkaliphila]|uniref:DUF6457 domain-containing protein n=1 Tax=Phytoactinopolyspora alkaliphila TaxID=1783498 RepID=UPI001C204D05|nr:DUF6457 domain-containing protein [Phytoactinopolyspora alkaliphila]